MNEGKIERKYLNGYMEVSEYVQGDIVLIEGKESSWRVSSVTPDGNFVLAREINFPNGDTQFFLKNQILGVCY